MREIARIIDANANRAREGLRVMEDVARFVLDDAALSESLKTIRHDLQGELRSALPAAALLASRDTEADVGTRISTSAERTRRGVRDIAMAAAGRAGEALRSIEEACKALGMDGGAFAALRYRLYTAERSLGLALAGPGAPQWRLCVLITERLCARPWQEVAEAAIAGGADCLQLREKEMEGGELLARAKRLRGIAGRSASVIINDRPDIAVLGGADGVHLGQDDLPVCEVRGLVGERLIIGASTANLEQVRRAAGADYFGLGPMFDTTTKHKPVLSGAAYLREFLSCDTFRDRPHLAIGGITPQNVGELWAAGCRGIAVSSAVCSADDPAEMCGLLLRGAPQAGHSQGSEGV